MASKLLHSATGSQVARLIYHPISISTQKFPRACSPIHNSRARFLVIAATNDDTQVQFSKCHGRAVPLKLETDKQHYVSTTGIASAAPPVSMKQWNLTDQHLFVLSGIAFLMGGAMTALFISAIPTLMAFKRAAESLEKLLDVTREELPGTMAAVRLSGMEISDLTMELSELGQEISSGVKNSARAVRAAQDGLRRVSSVASLALLQDRRAVPVGSMKREVTLPMRGLDEKFTGVRMVFQSLVTLRWIVGFIGRFWSWHRNRMLRPQ